MTYTALCCSYVSKRLEALIVAWAFSLMSMKARAKILRALNQLTSFVTHFVSSLLNDFYALIWVLDNKKNVLRTSTAHCLQSLSFTVAFKSSPPECSHISMQRKLPLEKIADCKFLEIAKLYKILWQFDCQTSKKHSLPEFAVRVASSLEVHSWKVFPLHQKNVGNRWPLPRPTFGVLALKTRNYSDMNKQKGEDNRDNILVDQEK